MDYISRSIFVVKSNYLIIIPVFVHKIKSFRNVSCAFNGFAEIDIKPSAKLPFLVYYFQRIHYYYIDSLMEAHMKGIFIDFQWKFSTNKTSWFSTKIT